jgi:hypothetical protein
MVGLREIRLLRLQDIRISPGLVDGVVKHILQLVPLPGIDGRDRFSVHGGTEV